MCRRVISDDDFIESLTELVAEVGMPAPPATPSTPEGWEKLREAELAAARRDTQRVRENEARAREVFQAHRDARRLEALSAGTDGLADDAHLRLELRRWPNATLAEIVRALPPGLRKIEAASILIMQGRFTTWQIQGALDCSKTVLVNARQRLRRLALRGHIPAHWIPPTLHEWAPRGWKGPPRKSKPRSECTPEEIARRDELNARVAASNARKAARERGEEVEPLVGRWTPEAKEAHAKRIADWWKNRTPEQRAAYNAARAAANVKRREGLSPEEIAKRDKNLAYQRAYKARRGGV